MRGRLHQAALFAVVPAGIVLVVVAPTTLARFAATVYALTLIGMYATSAAYHRLTWSPNSQPWIKLLDHAMIFLLIAGTYTPLALLVLRGPWRVTILALIWAGAALGIALKFVRVDGFTLVTSVLYGIMGWLAIVAISEIARAVSVTALALMFLGGLLYTGGGVVLARNRPDPVPSTFGYHEVWHSCVIAGSACHYGFILLITLGSGR
jgi:hemolysin III